MTVCEHIYQEISVGVERELVNHLLPLIKSDEKYLIAVCNCEVPRKAILRLYRTLKPIEELEAAEKKQLKEYVLESFKGSVRELVENCRIVYTLGSLFETYQNNKP
jgi:uncharacterized protein YnzC (UPF0291/DUF896 family)